MKLFSGVLFLVVAGSGALGCDALSGKVQEKAMAMAKDATEKAAKAAEGVAAQGPQAALSEGEQLAQKLDYTIKCTNGSKERAYGSWNYYTSGVNPETGMPIRVADEPLYSVVIGSGRALENIDAMRGLMSLGGER